MSSSEIHINPHVLVKADTNSRQNPTFYLLQKQSIISHPSKQRVFLGYGVLEFSRDYTSGDERDASVVRVSWWWVARGRWYSLLWKLFLILRKNKKTTNNKKQHSTKPTRTVEKFGPGNLTVIAWFVNENKNKTWKKKSTQPTHNI